MCGGCRQLGPVLHSTAAEGNGLKTSLLEAFVHFHTGQQQHYADLGLAPCLGQLHPPPLHHPPPAPPLHHPCITPGLPLHHPCTIPGLPITAVSPSHHPPLDNPCTTHPCTTLALPLDYPWTTPAPSLHYFCTTHPCTTPGPPLDHLCTTPELIHPCTTPDLPITSASPLHSPCTLSALCTVSQHSTQILNACSAQLRLPLLVWQGLVSLAVHFWSVLSHNLVFVTALWCKQPLVHSCRGWQP